MPPTGVGHRSGPLDRLRPGLAPLGPDRSRRRRRRALARRKRAARTSPPGALSRAAGALGVTGVVAALLVAAGVAMRAWLLFHVPVNADEAVVGLMAESIRHGHLPAFYWGQSYGGVEPYLVAAAYTLSGPSALMLGVVSSALGASAALATYAVGRRVTADRRLAAVAAAAAFAWPEAALWHSTTEYGFRGVTLLCGLVALWLAARIAGGDDRVASFVGVGLALGVGWWSSPEILYFVVPVLWCVGLSVTRRRAAWVAPGLLAGVRAASRAIPTGTPGADAALAAAGAEGTGADRPAPVAPWRWLESLVAVLVGAAPWIVTNLRSGFASLRASSAPVPAADRTGYVGRLAVFFHHLLPMMLGLVNPIRQGQPLHRDGAWVLGAPTGRVCYVVALVVIGVTLAACLWRGGPGRAVAVGAAALPFLYAVFPSSAFWQDGRYGSYLVPFVALVFVTGVERLFVPRRPASPGLFDRPPRAAYRRRCRALAAAAALVAGGLSAASFVQLYGPSGAGPGSFARRWGDPEAPLVRVLGALRAAGVRTAWAAYGVAYPLDLVAAATSGDQGLVVAPVGTVRDPALNIAVLDSARSAWIFYPPSSRRQAAAADAFLSWSPDVEGLSESAFEADLTRHHVGYRLVRTGVLDAVVPVSPFSPAAAGFPAADYR